MEGYTEFYISCNPPLLPNGVSLIITDLMKELESMVIEVLYEPEIPWFKFITSVEHRLEVSRWMHSRLDSLLTAEAGEVDANQGESDLEFKGRSDIEILTETPHIVSYPEFQDILKDILQEYEPFRYPEHLKPLPYKTVWQCPELFEGVTVTKLLSKYKLLWPSSSGEPSIEDLGELTKCQISHNLQGSLLYIGSNEDAGAINTTTRKLDILSSLMDTPLATTSHMLFTETSNPTRLCYRWLTHTGLSKLTYVDPTGSERNQEYDRIAGAVALRIETVNSSGHSVPDSTVYPIGPKTSTNWQTEFTPFSGYTYGNKRSGTTAISQHKRPHQCSQPHLLDKVGNQAKKFHKSIGCYPFTSNAQTSTKDSAQAADTIPSTEYPISHGAEHETPAVPIVAGNTFNLQTLQSHLPVTGKSNLSPEEIRTWLDKTGSMDSCPSSTGEESDHEGSANEASQKLPQTPNPALKPPELQLDGLGDILSLAQASGAQTSAPSAQRLPSHNLLGLQDDEVGNPVPVVVQTRDRQPSNLMDAVDDPINMPILGEILYPTRHKDQRGTAMAQNPSAEIVFGRQDDRPRDLFETMRQQAPAPVSSWANIASSKKPTKEEEHRNFGRNVPVKVVTDGRPKAYGTGEKEPARLDGSSAQVASGVGNTPKRRTQQQVQTDETKCRGSRPNLAPQSSRIVPGMDMPVLDHVDCSKIAVQAEAKLRELMQVVQVVPGKIIVKADFGRLCLKGESPSLVNNGQEPFWSASEVNKTLNSKMLDVGFYPILSTSGEEANLIPQLFGGRASWLPTNKQTFYEFLCVGETATAPLVIRVDADTFRHECLALPQELSQAYVHCTQRAWDVKFSVSRIDMGRITKGFEELAASLVRSMDIKTNEIGEIVIEAEPTSSSGWYIDRVRIHHEANYRNGGRGPSRLTITMTRLVERFPGIIRDKFRGQSVPAAPSRGGQLAQWFEASVSSMRVDEVMQENSRLEFGEKTRWTPETLDRQDALKAICEPALRMVSQMDQVGKSNENGHGPRTDRQAYDAVEDMKERNKNNFFW
ncbi:Ff.00g092820.m01.CDS01 [Fusarium sp. VM40]|nr:Ff.00g092820.m01.CDS01 [Fusarium sp. VM40]